MSKISDELVPPGEKEPMEIVPWDASFMSFARNGRTGRFDIIDGKFDYQGDLPVTDAALALFDYLAEAAPNLLVERFGAQALRRLSAIELQQEEAAARIERVARAMCEHDGFDWEPASCLQTANGEEPEEQRAYWRDKAEAAVAALYPTPVQVQESQTVGEEMAKVALDTFQATRRHLALHGASPVEQIEIDAMQAALEAALERTP